MGEASQVPAQANPRDLGQADGGAVWFVWAVWGIMLGGALLFVYSYGGKAPFMDEWSYVDVLTGHEQVNARWLWQQNNEHRIPLPKVVYLGLAWLTRSDFRAGMYFNAVALGLMAALFIFALPQQRGASIGYFAILPI